MSENPSCVYHLPAAPTHTLLDFGLFPALSFPPSSRASAQEETYPGLVGKQQAAPKMAATPATLPSRPFSQLVQLQTVAL